MGNCFSDSSTPEVYVTNEEGDGAGCGGGEDLDDQIGGSAGGFRNPGDVDYGSDYTDACYGNNDDSAGVGDGERGGSTFGGGGGAGCGTGGDGGGCGGGGCGGGGCGG